jgi:hypothetical protein
MKAGDRIQGNSLRTASSGRHVVSLSITRFFLILVVQRYAAGCLMDRAPKLESN